MYALDKTPLCLKLVDNHVETLSGSSAMTMRILIEAGSRGFTSGEANPCGYTYRWTQSIRDLRLKGFLIKSVTETTSAGSRIARYVLEQEIVPITCPKAAIL